MTMEVVDAGGGDTREEPHPIEVDPNIPHSSEDVEVSFKAEAECEKEYATTKYMFSLYRQVKMRAHERKPIEKRNVISYLFKIYKYARKKQHEKKMEEGYSLTH
uniref:Uncharacterized protein LOC105033822 isoform X2 n=1 Tax=Elaeis guineensis var. tenera TaxID=51953 RepID=A0A6I9QCP2_ELAGV|nr:uncharacterized protein LOC105033822 isoform X2 [Elaeis guineensis]